MENNPIQNKFRQWYLAGFYILLALPLFNLPPWLYPPDWGKGIIFRSIMAILLFLFVYQFLYKKNAVNFSALRQNKIVWGLTGLFLVYFIASIFSVDSYFSFWASPYRGGGFVTFAFYFIFAILTFIFLKEEDWKKTWIFSIFIGILVCLIGLFQFYGIFSNIFIKSSVISTIGNPIFLGIYLLLLFFPTLAFAIKENNKYLKIFYIFSLLVFLYTILIAGSRATYLGISTGVLCFLLLYPKKFKLLKICFSLFLICIFSIVFYINVFSNISNVSQFEYTKFQSIESRLLIKKAFSDERYKAWQTVIEEIKDKPILGWGPENLAVGFDKNYDPNITWSPWWDRAHNVFLDIGAQTGILGILAYISLFIALFWQLKKTKKSTDNNFKKIIITGIQATLAGYLVANFFSFDCFPTYLIFFFIIGYSLYLTNSDTANKNYVSKIKGKGIIISFLFLSLIIFLWQYNLLPFQVNTQINIADNWVEQKKCDEAFILMDKLLSKRSFIDSYLRMEYVSDIKKCAAVNPDKDLEYAKKGVKLLKEAVKIQPLYTRFWIYLGSFTTIIANNEQDQATKEDLIKEAYSYFDKAESLSPSHTETILERAKTDMVIGDYKKMEQDAEKCINIKSDLGDCYWMRALSELYVKNFDEAEQDIILAKKYNFDDNSTTALYQLVNVYSKTEQYQKLVGIYKKLISKDTTIAQYYASLAFTYAQIGEYKKARQEAVTFLILVPEAKDEVDAFLKTLPY